MKNTGLNRSYRLVWSDLHQTFIAVAEFARSKGKGSSKAAVVLATGGLVGLASMVGMAGLAQAADLPTGGTIVAGSGSIAQSGSTMTVTQTTGKMAADWQSFNIGAGNTVNFVQPSATAVALNRVLGADVSVIQGALNANGQVFLVNPNGVLFTPTAQVNVGAIVASTLNLSTADFMAGNYTFDSGSRNADEGYSVINHGSITAHGDGGQNGTGGKGGTIALIAAKIINTGSLIATGGNVLLGAGSQVLLDLGGPVKLQVTKGTLNTLIEQGGAIRADGGLVYLSAKAAGELAASVIQSSGLIEASSLRSEGGEIILEADTIHLQAGSRTLASGATGGGTVLVGGDWQGSGTLRQATQVTLDAGARIDASATEAGNGGKVVLWSDVHSAQSQTRAYGAIAAKGGSQGGNGGQIETSGHWLDVEGITANASASIGTAGEWLLDPYNITISGATTTAGPSFPNWTSATASSIVKNTDIQTQLNAGTSVTLATGSGGAELGNISVTANIAKTAGGDATLTLNAHGGIQVSAGVSISSTVGKLNTVLWADSDATNGGSILMGNAASATSTGTSILSNGGDITLGGGSNILTGYAKQSTQNTNDAGILLAGTKLDSGGGNIIIRGEGLSGSLGGNVHGVWMRGGTEINSGTGTVTITGKSPATTGYRNGVITEQSQLVQITSASASTNAINIVGDATTTIPTGADSCCAFGVFFWAGTLVSATGGGGITIDGTGGTSTSGGGGVQIEPQSYILANSGPINITGRKGPGSIYEDVVVNSYIGFTPALTGSYFNGISSPVTTSSSDITIYSDTLSNSRIFTGGTPNSAVQSSGILKLAPRTTGKNLAVQTAVPGDATAAWINLGTMFGASGLFKTGFSKVVFGSSTTGNVTLDNYSFDNDTELNTSGNAVLGAVTIANSKALTVNMTGSGTITDTGKVAVANLLLNGSTSAATLDSATNAIGTVAGTVASLTLVNGTALLLGSVGGTDGITATDDVSIATLSGDLTLAKNISTSATSATAITLNAGKTSAAGTATGGNIIISGSPSFSTGTGGRVTLYTGSVSGSTGLTALVGSGSGKFRYNSDESSTGYNATTAALGSGVYGIYREQPKFTVTADNASKTYDGLTFSGGTSVTTGSLVNGDSSELAVGALTYGGTAQTAKNAGSYSIVPSGLSSDLGYGYTYVNGALTVSPAPLTVTANAASKTYDGAAYSGGNGVAYSGFVNSETDSVLGGTLGYTGTSQGATNAGSYAITPGGLTSSNYTVSFVDGLLTINSAALTVITGNLTGSVTKTYDGSSAATLAAGNYFLSGWVGSDAATVTKTSGTYDNANAGSGKTVTVSLTNSDYSATGSTNLGNYTLPTSISGSVGNISAAPLSVTANAASKTYDGVAYSGGNGVAYSGFVNSETDSVLGGTLGYTGTSQGATNAGSYAITPGGLTSSNYTVGFVDGALTISAAPPNSATPSNASVPVEQAAITVATQATSQGDSGGQTTTGGTLASNTAFSPLNFFTTPGADTASGANTSAGQSISGGLALVEVAETPPSGQNSGAGNMGGFMKVFVVNGGINVGLNSGNTASDNDIQPTSTR